MTDQLIATVNGRIKTLTLNRPSEGNGFNDEMARAFVDAIERADGEADVVLIRGNGQNFCTGRARTPGTPLPATEAYARRDEYDLIFNCYAAIRRAPMPVVGAIQGQALGLGAAFAALCDVSFAGRSAAFSIPEMAHNIMPTMVMSALFDRLNRNAILWMSYSAELITADEAARFGLVSRVVDDDAVTAAAEELCRKIVAYPRPATRGLKEYLRSAPSMHEQGAIDYARSLHAMVNTSSQLKKSAV